DSSLVVLSRARRGRVTTGELPHLPVNRRSFVGLRLGQVDLGDVLIGGDRARVVPGAGLHVAPLQQHPNVLRLQAEVPLVLRQRGRVIPRGGVLVGGLQCLLAFVGQNISSVSVRRPLLGDRARPRVRDFQGYLVAPRAA